MKKIIIVSLFLVSCKSVPVTTLAKQEVVDLPGLKQSAIFDKSVDWLAESFVDSKAVIEVKDRSRGKIIGKIVTTNSLGIMSDGIKVDCTMIIEAKDGRARLSYNPTEARFSDTPRDIYGDGEKEKIQASFDDVTQSYKKYFKSKSDNW